MTAETINERREIPDPDVLSSTLTEWLAKQDRAAHTEDLHSTQSWRIK